MTRRACESIRPLISAFMDGELTPDESRALHEHLDSCADCRQIFNEYRLFRDEIRRLPPEPVPPENLARQVWRETIGKSRSSRTYRWFGISEIRFSLSAVAAIAILVIATAFLLVRGYQQGIPPAVAGSQPVAAQTWPVYQPIEITFNKPMDKASVVDNLATRPASEATRLPISWRGNTLIIGADPSRSVVLIPDTDYTVAILGSAKDSWGNSIGQPWMISFHTGPITLAAQTPTSSPTATQPPATPTQPSQVAESQTTPSPTKSGSGASATPTEQSPTQPATPAESASGTQTPVSGTGTPSTTPASPAATPTASQSPTATPTASPNATPSATPDATPATPATGDATPSPTGSPNATPTPVTGAFGSVYWAKSPVRDTLGTPTGPEYSVNAAVLDFQRGTMYERLDSNTIYILFADGSFKSVPDTWTSSDGIGGGAGPQPNLWIPNKSFGKVWSDDQTLTDTLGYAVSADAHYMEGKIQDFANGHMLYSDEGFVYVLYQDGTWEQYPDASGNGDLLTPTPGSGTGTPSPTGTTGTPSATPTLPPTPESASPSTGGATTTPTPTPTAP